nr:hypothetical protein [uncultured Methanolobus sp.]
MVYIKPLSEEKIQLYLSNYANNDNKIKIAFAHFRSLLEIGIRFESEKKTFEQMDEIILRSKEDPNKVIELRDFPDEKKFVFLNHIFDYLDIDKFGKYFVLRRVNLLCVDKKYYYLLEATKNGVVIKYEGENSYFKKLELKEGLNRGFIKKSNNPTYLRKYDYC